MALKRFMGDDKISISIMSGKMNNMFALSTSPLTNPMCNKNRKIAGSICEKCYSIQFNKMRPSLRRSLKRNTEVLTKKVYQVEECPLLNVAFFRFEPFGDLQNSIQLQNYVNICLRNTYCKFALWTKNIKLAEEFFDGHKKPDNLQLVYSSLMINKPLDMSNYNHADKIFTVYDKGYDKGHDDKINCSDKCFRCKLCYNKNNVIHIGELKK